MVLSSLCTGVFLMESGFGRLMLPMHNSIPRDDLTYKEIPIQDVLLVLYPPLLSPDSILPPLCLSVFIPFLSCPHMYIIITSDVIIVIYIVQLRHYSGNLDTLGTKIFVLIFSGRE